MIVVILSENYVVYIFWYYPNHMESFNVSRVDCRRMKRMPLSKTEASPRSCVISHAPTA